MRENPFHLQCTRCPRGNGGVTHSQPPGAARSYVSLYVNKLYYKLNCPILQYKLKYTPKTHVCDQVPRTHVRNTIHARPRQLCAHAHIHKVLGAHARTSHVRAPPTTHLSNLCQFTPPPFTLSRHVRTCQTAAVELTFRTAFVFFFQPGSSGARHEKCNSLRSILGTPLC